MLFLAGFLASSSWGAQVVTGAGATFPYPLYSKWFAEYGKLNPNVQINYQSIGSGGGIRQLLDKTIDFGASDSPMTDEQLGKASGPIVHIPTAMGAVVLIYNLAGSTNLKLSSDVLADVFLGTIKKWNDPRILALNPGLAQTSDIFVVHRSDGSGTTGIFSDYMAKVSSDWKTKVGSGTALNWPTGLGGKGNEGVTGLVKQTPGSIGYVELIYAESNKLSFFALKNKAGQFVTPTLKSVTAAAAGLKEVPDDLRFSITDSDGAGSYPISGATYILVYKTMPDSAKAASIVSFLKWALKDGQKMAAELLYAPLPSSLVKKVQKKVETIEVKRAG